jgi:hypothetical protein
MPIDKPKRIGGFDKWEVESAARTLMEAEKIKNGDPKFLKVVQKECDKIAEAAQQAALEKKTAAKLIKVFK